MGTYQNTNYNMKVLFIFATFVAISSSLSTETIENAKTDIKATFDLVAGSAATAMRLSFHDCVSDSCDGCINQDNDSNNGLSTIITNLDAAYVGVYDSEMSRADFWQLAFISAIERLARSINGVACDYPDCPVINFPDIDFKYGRVDCATSPDTTEVFDFPGAAMGRDEMFAWFKDHFGFNSTQVVALMGAHTVGRNRQGQSGYNGEFVVDGTSTLDNQYYVDMLDDSVTWSSEFISRTSKYQWAGGDAAGNDYGTRLHTDLELVYNIETNDDGSPQCGDDSDVTACEEADTKSDVERYAASNDDWAYDFIMVYTEVMNHGATNLADPE